MMRRHLLPGKKAPFWLHAPLCGEYQRASHRQHVFICALDRFDTKVRMRVDGNTVGSVATGTRLGAASSAGNRALHRQKWHQARHSQGHHADDGRLSSRWERQAAWEEQVELARLARPWMQVAFNTHGIAHTLHLLQC